MSQIIKGDYQAVLEKNGTLSFVPNGVSMWPFIKNRSQTVIIESVTTPPVKYDVVFFKRQDGSYVLHRIIEDLGDHYLVKGDSLFCVEPVKKEQIIGIMTGFYKGRKYIPATDKKYLSKVDKWYKNRAWTRFRIKNFNFWQRVKNKLKRIFSKKESR